MSQPKKDPLNDYYNELSATRKVLFMIGVLCLVASAMLTIFNLGFDISSSTSSTLGFMSDTTMWAVNVTLGMIGGLCFAPRKMVPAIIAGGVTTATITAITLFYTSWRITIRNGVIDTGIHRCNYRMESFCLTRRKTKKND